MAKISWPVLIFLCWASSFIACSSIKKKAVQFYLSGLRDQKAEKAIFLSPPSPYKKQSHPVLDALWWNPQAASSISYFSSCSKVQKSLEEFQKNAIPQRLKLIQKTTSQKNVYSVLLDPQKKTYSGVWTTKKGDCLFNINLVSPSRASFKKEELVFKALIKGFLQK